MSVEHCPLDAAILAALVRTASARMTLVIYKEECSYICPVIHSPNGPLDRNIQEASIYLYT